MYLELRSLRGGPFDIWGGGGLRKIYLNNLFIFSQFGNFFFILPAVKNKIFFSFMLKMKQFFSTYFCEPMGHAVNFDHNRSISVGSLVM